MGDACRTCGGKGYVWTGDHRELCRECMGDGHPHSREEWGRGPMPWVEDPIRQGRR